MSADSKWTSKASSAKAWARRKLKRQNVWHGTNVTLRDVLGLVNFKSTTHQGPLSIHYLQFILAFSNSQFLPFVLLQGDSGNEARNTAHPHESHLDLAVSHFCHYRHSKSTDRGQEDGAVECEACARQNSNIRVRLP